MGEGVQRLTELYGEIGDVPPVAAARREWGKWAGFAHGPDSASDSLFIVQTYVALIARLASRRFIEPGYPIGGPDELWEVVSGAYFVRLGLENFLTEDFFTWPFFHLSLGIGTDDEALAATRWLNEQIEAVDLACSPPGLLAGVFEAASPTPIPYTPRWLAEFLLEDEAVLTGDPRQTMLDPSCGAGAFLAAAVGIVKRRSEEQGQPSMDALLQITGGIRGMSTGPLAVTVSKAAYLFALGDLAREPHPPVVVPVYLADAALVPEWESGDVCSVPATGGLRLPGRVARDPMLADWLLARLPNYMKGAAVRLHAQPEEDAVQEVLNAYYNYLTAPKSRTPIPDPLSAAEADVMLETARELVVGYIRGGGHAALHTVRNAVAPAFFTGQKVSALACGLAALGTAVPPFGLESLARCASIYLEHGGKAIAAGELNYLRENLGESGPLAWERSLEIPASDGADLLAISGGTGKSSGPLIARRMRGQSPAGDATWAEAKERIRITMVAGPD